MYERYVYIGAAIVALSMVADFVEKVYNNIMGWLPW